MVNIPKSRVDVDPNFEKQLRHLKDLAREAEQQLLSGNCQVKNMRFLDWEGSPFDYESLAQACNRDKANEQFIDAVKDPKNPGVTGDLVSATLMIDYMGSLQRAAFNRYTMTKARRIAHMAGRKKGHGADTGVFMQCGVEYLRRLVKKAKGGQ